ncbi:MAG TPA: tetratricopeptide repeat protein [Bacteroidia bacterium]|nr:tetratricopeptide repeat protein [Bacteroidia bacterium]
MKTPFTGLSWLNNKLIALFGFSILLFFFISANAQKDQTEFPEDDLLRQQGFDLLNDFPRVLKNAPLAKAKGISEERLKIAETRGNKKGMAAASNTLGLIWLKKGDFTKALDYFLKSLNIRKELNDKKGMALTAAETGFVYQQMKDIEKALQYYYNSYEISKEQRLPKMTADIAGLIGAAYMQKRDTVYANKYFNEALNGFLQLKDKKAAAVMLNKMGELYLMQNDYRQSLGYFERSFTIKEELKDKPGKALELRNEGIVYFKKGDYEKALDYFNQSLKISDQLIVKKLVKDTYLKLATIYSFSNDFDNADKYHTLYRELKDSLLRIEKTKKISGEKMQDEIFEKEKVIELLSRENEQQTKVLNQQGLELSRQLTATELERQSKEKALEELSVAMIEKKEKEKQLLLALKAKAENELELSKKELELRKKSELMNALIGGTFIILLLTFFIYNRYRYKKKSHDALDKSHSELKQTLEKLKTTQDQLVHSQKMASLGKLTAGIAHEIQNPLNFVNNFSDLSIDLLGDLKNGIAEEEKNEIVEQLKQNLSKVIQHGKRADSIVKNMLQHSRTGTQEKQMTNINELAEEFLNLAYHGMRAADPDFNCTMTKHLDLELPKINVVSQEISRVLLNIFSNAFYELNKKSKTAGKDYEPKIGITTRKQNKKVVIKIMDNADGIPENIRDKIFEPFFSTKPPGEGTGIGLSLSYDIIVNGHGGNIQAESKENEGTTFVIELPY